MQSGMKRGETKEADSHEGTITGLVCDGINRVVISSSIDSTIKIWDFRKLILNQTVKLNSIPSNLVYNKSSDIFAYSNQKNDVILTDSITLKQIRIFSKMEKKAKKNEKAVKINCICFSSDSKLIIASSDCMMRVFDMLTGSLIDWIKFKQEVKSMDFSPTGEFLATTHFEQKGICLWTSKTFYGNTDLSQIKHLKAPIQLRFPLIASDYIKKRHADFYGQNEIQDESQVQQKEDEIDQAFSELLEQEKEQKYDLLNDAHPKWQALYHMDQITDSRSRLKPKKSLAGQTPFFLFDLDSLLGETDTTLLKENLFTSNNKKDSLSKIIGHKTVESHSELRNLLKSYCGTQKIVDYIVDLAPGTIEKEMMNLETVDLDDNNNYVSLYLDHLVTILEGKYVDLYVSQILIQNFMKVNQDNLMKEDMKLKLKRLLIVQDKIMKTGKNLESLINENICMTNHLISN